MANTKIVVFDGFNIEVEEIFDDNGHLISTLFTMDENLSRSDRKSARKAIKREVKKLVMAYDGPFSDATQGITGLGMSISYCDLPECSC